MSTRVRFVFRVQKKGTYITCPIFPQAGATGDRVQGSCLLFYRGLAMILFTQKKGSDESQQEPVAPWSE